MAHRQALPRLKAGSCGGSRGPSDSIRGNGLPIGTAMPPQYRFLLSHVGPDAYAPMTRVLLGKLGYLILLPEELASIEGSESLRRVADDVVCLECPENFGAVGYWYVDFAPTTDAEVIECLGTDARRIPA